MLRIAVAAVRSEPVYIVRSQSHDKFRQASRRRSVVRSQFIVNECTVYIEVNGHATTVARAGYMAICGEG